MQEKKEQCELRVISTKLANPVDDSRETCSEMQPIALGLRSFYFSLSWNANALTNGPVRYNYDEKAGFKYVATPNVFFRLKISDHSSLCLSESPLLFRDCYASFSAECFLVNRCQHSLFLSSICPDLNALLMLRSFSTSLERTNGRAIIKVFNGNAMKFTVMLWFSVHSLWGYFGYLIHN